MSNRYKFTIACVFFALMLLLPGLSYAADNPEVKKLLDRARFEYQDESYQAALSFLDQAAKLDPADLDVQYLRGLVLARLERYAEALDFLKKVVKADPVGRKAVLIEIANLYSAKKDNTNALIYINQAIEAFPERPDLFLSRGLIYMNKRDYSAAEADFTRVAKIDPRLSAFATYHLALLSYQRDNSIQAKAYLKEAMAMDIDPALLENCKTFLANIEKEEKSRRFFSGSATVTFKYDDNVINEPLETAGLTAPGESTDKDDWSFAFSLKGSVNVINRRSVRAGLSYNYFSNAYEHLTENNLIAHLVTAITTSTAAPITSVWKSRPIITWLTAMKSWIRAESCRP